MHRFKLLEIWRKNPADDRLFGYQWCIPYWLEEEKEMIAAIAKRRRELYHDNGDSGDEQPNEFQSPKSPAPKR